MPSTTAVPTDARVQRMLTARAAHVDQVRRAVLRDLPGADADVVDVEVQRRLNLPRSLGGRVSAARRAAEIAAAREIVAAVPAMIAHTQTHLDYLRQLATLAEDVA